MNGYWAQEVCEGSGGEEGAVGLLTAAESGLRREANKLAEGYLRPPGDIGLVVGLLVRDE